MPNVTPVNQPNFRNGSPLVTIQIALQQLSKAGLTITQAQREELIRYYGNNRVSIIFPSHDSALISGTGTAVANSNRHLPTTEIGLMSIFHRPADSKTFHYRGTADLGTIFTSQRLEPAPQGIFDLQPYLRDR